MAKRRTIGSLAREAGVSVETIRFYERKGLLEQPQALAGYRHYDDRALALVRYIKLAQRLGLKLADLAALRARLGEGDGFCSALRGAAQLRLAQIAAERAELDRLESELTGFLTRCEQRPATIACPILVELGRASPAQMATGPDGERR